MNKLKELRKQRGITQNELGRWIRKYQVRIWQIENGYSQAAEWEKQMIAAGLGARVEEVFPPGNGKTSGKDVNKSELPGENQMEVKDELQ